MFAVRSFVAVASALCLTGCARTPDSQQLAQDAITAMGGAERLRGIQTLTMENGEGKRWRAGQSRRVTDADEPGDLTQVIDTVDFANGRAALDYQIRLPDGFSQHRTEVMTKRGDSLVGLEYVPNRPTTAMSASSLFGWGSQDSPQALLYGNVVRILLEAAGAAPGDTPQDRQLDGRAHRLASVPLRSGSNAGLFFDAESKLLSAIELTMTDMTLGDVPVQYVLADYRDVAGVRLPHKISIRKDGQPYSEVQYSSASINSPKAQERFAIPAEVAADVDRAIAAGDYSPVTLTTVADGVHFARAYSHNSLVVEFPSFLAVVEAAYSDAQMATLARLLKEQFPNKPIRYAAVTHHHIDHTGGVRGMAAEGAIILTAKGHEPAIRQLLAAKHTLIPDRLETSRKEQPTAGMLEVFEGKKVISEGNQILELYAITDGPHVDPAVIAYLPGARVLFNSDLYNPGRPGPASPEAVHLYQSVRKLNLRVATNVGGHGSTGPFGDLEKGAAAAAKAAAPQ